MVIHGLLSIDCRMILTSSTGTGRQRTRQITNLRMDRDRFERSLWFIAIVFQKNGSRQLTLSTATMSKVIPLLFLVISLHVRDAFLTATKSIETKIVAGQRLT